MEIVVTSDNQNPANFVSNFVDSINVNDGYEIAVKSIFSPPLFNFTEDNNEFTVVTVINGKEYYYSYAIKPGFYENTRQLLQKMQQSIKSSIMKRVAKPPKWTPTLSSNPQSVTLNMNNAKRKDASQYFIFGGDVKDSLLRDLGLCASEKTMVAKLDINNYSFDEETICGFLYSNIVENSLINQQQSRLLACIPLSSASPYNFFEFHNPVCRAFSVHSFTDLNFVLTYVDDDILRMKGGIPTVITLSIRKKL